jgi:hypothetical protein
MYSWPAAARFPSIRHKYERQAGDSPLLRCHATLIWPPVQVRITDLAAKSGLGGPAWSGGSVHDVPAANTLEFVMTNPAGEIGQLREDELPVVRVIVPPDQGGRVFEDDLDPGDLVFDGMLTPMLVWHEHYPIGRGWRSGWVLSYDTDGHGNPDDYIVGLRLPDVDAAVVQARQYLRSVGYPAAGW